MLNLSGRRHSLNSESVFESLRIYNVPIKKKSFRCELSRRRVKASRKPWNERVQGALVRQDETFYLKKLVIKIDSTQVPSSHSRAQDRTCPSALKSSSQISSFVGTAEIEAINGRRGWKTEFVALAYQNKRGSNSDAREHTMIL